MVRPLKTCTSNLLRDIMQFLGYVEAFSLP